MSEGSCAQPSAQPMESCCWASATTARICAQHGVWMSRQEAYEVAKAAGQPINDSACRPSIDGGMKLHSEGIY